MSVKESSSSIEYRVEREAAPGAHADTSHVWRALLFRMMSASLFFFASMLLSLSVTLAASASVPSSVHQLQIIERAGSGGDGCHDDPTYQDIYNCAAWAGYACRAGGWGIDTAERILRLVNSCPEA